MALSLSQNNVQKLIPRLIYIIPSKRFLYSYIVVANVKNLRAQSVMCCYIET